MDIYWVPTTDPKLDTPYLLCVSATPWFRDCYYLSFLNKEARLSDLNEFAQVNKASKNSRAAVRALGDPNPKAITLDISVFFGGLWWRVLEG